MNPNKRVGRKYRYKNEYYSLMELSALSGISGSTIRSRLGRGLSVRKALEPPVKGKEKKHYRYKNKKHSLVQLAELSCVSQEVLEARLERGFTVKDAVELPLFVRLGNLKVVQEAELIEGISELVGISKKRVKTLLSKKWSAQKIIASKQQLQNKPPEAANTKTPLSPGEKAAIKALESQWKNAKPKKGAPKNTAKLYKGKRKIKKMNRIDC